MPEMDGGLQQDATVFQVNVKFWNNSIASQNMPVCVSGFVCVCVCVNQGVTNYSPDVPPHFPPNNFPKKSPLNS